MKLYTSKEILAKDDLYDLQDTFSGSGIAFQYKLTESELGWAKAIEVYNKYSIAVFVNKNTKEGILTFNCPFELSKAIQDDGMYNKAVMLPDTTALQKLFFWLSLDEDQV